MEVCGWRWFIWCFFHLLDDADDEEEDMDTGEGTATEPKNSLDDGESAEIKGGLHGANVYRIKRTGDTYYCT